MYNRRLWKVHCIVLGLPWKLPRSLTKILESPGPPSQLQRIPALPCSSGPRVSYRDWHWCWLGSHYYWVIAPSRQFTVLPGPVLVDVTYFPLYPADRVSCVTFEGGRRGRRLSSLGWNSGWLGIAKDVGRCWCWELGWEPISVYLLIHVSHV